MCASEHDELKGLVPTLKISDFGLCRIMEANLTKASTFVGTFSYIGTCLLIFTFSLIKKCNLNYFLAPEMLTQINGLGVKREYDYKVDIWSL